MQSRAEFCSDMTNPPFGFRHLLSALNVGTDTVSQSHITNA